MHCEEAAHALYAGRRTPEVELHLSACDECRLLAEDLAGLSRAFARARAEWAPSPAFRVDLPRAPWRRLAIAACLLVLPLAGWAYGSLRPSRPSYDVAPLLLDSPAAAAPSDRQLLATLFLEESSR
jgi:hypothetical protein